ncbi:DUF2059 domain-containing protein [Loktanella sp. IMCC34160]|uniref:DUF2059 domain-containing protein n=1 Tax=Loktanella sp. IMCC34160 TaxID=2510646 RepID=UPI00101CCBDA|nr:DUF2059 domain-containing protein [Loktanella sp. IMCC34160]RYG92219.1 DUF2059 domain-containing protein [Loktanella sp. IMCC34160]
MSLRFSLVGAVFSTAMGLPAFAQSETGDIDRLFDATGLPELIGIMREEGLSHADQLASDLFQGGGGPRWDSMIDRVYDVERMEARVRMDFAASLEGEDIGPLLDFFGSDLGMEIVSLEISARRAFLDPEVEAAAIEAAAIAAMDETDRHQLLTRFIEVNDLIESNVVGGLNSNYAFYIGMADAGAFGGELTESDILTDVWSQEPEVRASTTEWVYSFLGLAYQPLSDSDVEAYIALSETDIGQAMNRALFNGFDGMFNDLSRGLGLAAGEMMTGADL